MTTYDTADEAITAKRTELGDDFTDFEGNNCADSWDEGSHCLGWDGESRRCDCGNRRVYWETNKTDDGKFYAYAVAY